MEHTNGYQCQPSCCCTCHVNKMIRLACLIDISMLLQGGLERRGCVVGQKQSVAAEKCVLWKGLAICWRGGRGQKAGWTMSPSTLWLLFTRWEPAQSLIKDISLISFDHKHHNKCHLAFWSSSHCGCTDESPTSAFYRALLSSPEWTVAQSWTLNCKLGFHADTQCTSHGWESQRRKNSQSWQQRRYYITL